MSLLPKPEEIKKRRRKKSDLKCLLCKGPLSVSKTVRGWAYCEACGRGESIPIGYIATRGAHKGKEVHLARNIIREYSQDGTLDEAKEDLEAGDLGDRNFFVLNEIEYD